MTNPSITYGHGFLTDCEDIYDVTGTADSGSETTTVDAERTEAEDYWNGAYIYFTSGDNAGLARKVTDFDAGTDTITHAAFPEAVAEGDTYKLSEWFEDQAATLAISGLTVLHDDIFWLSGTATAAAQSTYWECDISNVSSSIYTEFILRYKTSESAVGLGARARLEFTDDEDPLTDDFQWILGESAPEFTTTWKVVRGTITADRTVDKVRFYAVSDAACTAKYVLYDFLLLHKGTFTFPQFDNVVFDVENVYADLHPFGRVGDIQQYGGMNSPPIRVEGKIDVEPTSWGTPYGEYLYYIMREACNDPWQWFTSDLINCKVTPRRLHLAQDSGSEALRLWSLELKKYDRSSGAETTWANKQFYGFETP